MSAPDGDSKIDAKKRTGDPQFEAQTASIRTTHGHLPAGDTLSAGKVDETAAVRIFIQLAPVPTPAARKPESSECSDGFEQPQKMATACADDLIAALQRQLEEQQVATASLRSELEEHRSAQLLWNASLAERVGKLEGSGNAVVDTDVIISLGPDTREATGDQPKAVAEINPDATVDGAENC